MSILLNPTRHMRKSWARLRELRDATHAIVGRAVKNISRTRTGLVALFLLLLAASLTDAFDTVVIDPGHGGIDEGTAWYHVKEKDTALAVALRLQKLLQESGIKCVLTRSTDTYVSL